MSAAAPELSDRFPLTHMAGILREFAPPAGDFDPAGAWSHRYKVYSLTGGDAPVGWLSLRRAPGQSGRFTLHIDYGHPLNPDVYTRRFEAEMECAADMLATPVAWSVKGWAEDRAKALVPQSEWSREGRAAGDAVLVEDALGERRYPFSGALAGNWTLFEAVQRMPHARVQNEAFTLLDDFARLKPGQTLGYREPGEAAAGGNLVRRERDERLEKGTIRRVEWFRENPRIVELHAYDQTGWGTVPWVYFVDGDGRLLLAVSGIEGYVLDTGST